MRLFRVVATDSAREDLSRFIDYLLYVKKSVQAALNVLEDYDDTLEQLTRVGDSLAPCDNPELRKRGYHRINYLRHRYFMLYRVDGDIVIVHAVGHELQDIQGFIH